MNNNVDLKKLQKELVKMLKEVDRVCRKNNITYFLVGGSLLGAKRHSGFIPWDDDLDIGMLRSDYEKFEKLASTEFKHNLYFKDFNLNNDYYLPFGKVCKKNTSYITELDSELTSDNEIFIDVFPLDFVKNEDSLSQKIQANKIKGLKSVIIRRKQLNVEKTSAKVKVFQFICIPFKTKSLMRYQEKIMKKNNNKKNMKYLVNNGSNYNYKKQTMPYDFYFPAKEMDFEGEKFMIPNQTEKVLEKIYGNNYMELPPKEKRVTHKIIKLEY